MPISTRMLLTTLAATLPGLIACSAGTFNRKGYPIVPPEVCRALEAPLEDAGACQTRKEVQEVGPPLWAIEAIPPSARWEGLVWSIEKIPVSDARDCADALETVRADWSNRNQMPANIIDHHCPSRRKGRFEALVLVASDPRPVDRRHQDGIPSIESLKRKMLRGWVLASAVASPWATPDSCWTRETCTDAAELAAEKRMATIIREVSEPAGPGWYSSILHAAPGVRKTGQRTRCECRQPVDGWECTCSTLAWFEWPLVRR